VTRLAALVASGLLGLTLGCGKYGAPVRAGAEPQPEKKPGFEIPLPTVRESEPAAPAAPLPPPSEEEPPPEGAP
jgi:hypothetical protein